MVTETKTYKAYDGRQFDSLSEAETWERRLNFALDHLSAHGNYTDGARLHAAAVRLATAIEIWDARHRDPAAEFIAEFIAGADPDVPSLPDDPGGDAEDDLGKAA